MAMGSPSSNGPSGAEVSTTINSSAPQTVVSNSTSGTTTFAMPFQGSSYKKVIISCAAALGTAGYTFPVPFTVTPQVFGSGAALVTTLSTSACVVTGTTSSTVVFIEGL